MTRRLVGSDPSPSHAHTLTYDATMRTVDQEGRFKNPTSTTGQVVMHGGDREMHVGGG